MDAEESTAAGGRDWTRVALLVGCVLAATTAAMLVPSLGSDGLQGSPIDTVLPGERFDDGRGAGAGSGGFGALNPGDSTGVGGETGFDKDTFGNNDTEIHFEVESSESAYWRTGTYGTYTGEGWERDVDREPYDGSIETPGLTGDRIVYEVEFEQAASALPTAWRPTSISGVDNLAVTETGSVLAPDSVDAGSTFSGVSRKPVRDVDVLRAAGSAYPQAVEQRYTQLPDGTPTRVGEFTEELTADDETPYDTATTIQNWLRSEKGYSLQASEQSDHIADTFIFEMEAGYCEYFATAMTTMLRSQGIPARYTVGYSTGQQVEENRYEVRGMNAHAWVEVYFPDVGWVRFDPTPGGSRLQAQQETLEEEQPDLEYNASEEGSPGELFEPGSIEELPNNGTENGEENGSGGVYDVSLNRTAVPGVAVEVTVTLNDSPVSGATVLFNGEPVGETDSEGTVVATVPETEELRIQIDAITDQSAAVGSFTGPETFAAPVPPPGEESGSWLLAASDGTLTASESQVDEENATVIDVETEASISVSGDQFPGEEVTVVVTVDDIAIGEAELFLDGQQVGVTDGDGQATVTLPSDPGNSTLAVERGPIFGQTDVRVQAVELDVDTGLVALPLTEATAEVTADGDGIADAPVVVDGTEIARTGPDGTATVRLPLSSSTTVLTTQGGLSREVTVDGLYRNAGAVGVGTGLVIGLPLLFAYSRGYRPRDVGSLAVGALARARRALVGLLVRGNRFLRAVISRASKTLVYLARFGAGKESAAGLGTALAGWLRARREWLARVLSVRNRGGSESTDGETATGPAEIPTVRKAWNRFLRTLDVEEPETQTPGELATRAVEEDALPQGPVETLRDAFREVEYGDRRASDRVERVKEAIEAIEDAAQESSGDEATEAVESVEQTESQPAGPRAGVRGDQ